MTLLLSVGLSSTTVRNSNNGDRVSFCDVKRDSTITSRKISLRFSRWRRIIWLLHHDDFIEIICYYVSEKVNAQRAPPCAIMSFTATRSRVGLGATYNVVDKRAPRRVIVVQVLDVSKGHRCAIFCCGRTTTVRAKTTRKRSEFGSIPVKSVRFYPYPITIYSYVQQRTMNAIFDVANRN